MEGEDAPFYYTERANVGVLSGAAWKAGWLALEEFGVKKRGKKRGSCDLYIHSIDGKQGEYIEAKHTWSIKSASDALSQAKGDARKLLVRKNEEALVIAVVFVAPSINKKFEEQYLTRSIIICRTINTEISILSYV
jgi:hypothetical protein